MPVMPNVNFDELLESACQASNLLRALGNEYRLIILCHLLSGEHQVAELQDKLDLSQSSLSQHLARLRHEGLVQTRRESQAIFYSLAGDKVQPVLEVLFSLYCAPEQVAKTHNQKIA